MVKIPLTRGKVAIVDDADAAYLLNFKWFAACGPVAGEGETFRDITAKWTYRYHDSLISRAYQFLKRIF